MKRAGQAEGGLIGADCCTHTDAAEQSTQGCKLSCFVSLALPQDPAVGRACVEQGTALGVGPRAGRTRVQGGSSLPVGVWAEAHGHPRHGGLVARAVEHQRAAAGLVRRWRRAITFP